VLKGYGVSNVTGDNYAGEWPVASFRNEGVAYERCEKNKSELYLAFVPVTNSGGVELPDDKRLFIELRRLERKCGRAGKDTVDHPPRPHDDLANSVAGLSFLLINAESSQSNGGFNAAKHISQQRLIPIRGAPIGIGITLTSPTASVVGQAHNDRIEIYAAFVSNAGLKTHIAQNIRPWLYQNAGWALNDWQQLLGCYEDMEEGAMWSLAAVVTEALAGDWQPAAVPIEARREAMLSALSKAQTFTFQPAFQVDPAGAEFIAPALSRPYDPKDKSVYAAIAKALSLLISRIEQNQNNGPLPKITVNTYFNALDRSTWAGGR
jgi:hypothetical protein